MNTPPFRRRRSPAVARVPRVLSAAAALVAATTLTACSSTDASEPTADDPVTITFSSYTYGTQGPAGEGMQALLDRFAELHPEITVEAQSVPTADVLTKARADVAAGSAPDVVQLGYSKLAEAFEALPVASLEEIAGDGWDDHVDGINPALVSTGELDGAVAALPFTVSTPTLFYNADLFRQAGLDPESPPATMDDVRSAATAIADLGPYGAYFAIADTGKSDYLTQSVINSAGGAVVDKDGTPTFDSEAAVDGIGQIQALTEEGLQPAVAVEDALAAFSSGNLGMFVVSTAVANNLQAAAEGSFELRASGFPAFGDEPAAPTFSGAGLIVLSDDEQKQRAAWELVEFMTSEEGYTMVTEQIGYLPLREDLVTDPEHLQGYFAENTLLLTAIEQLDSVEPYRFFPGENANEAVVLLQTEAVEPIVLRGADPEQTLSEVAGRVKDLAGE